MKYVYHGYDRSGAPSRGMLEATDPRDALEQARQKGVFVTKVAPAAAGLVESGPRRPSLRNGLLGGKGRLDKVAFMARQLSLLTGTGTPVVDALSSLERQAPPGDWKHVLGDLRAKLEEGRSLAESMAEHPVYFDAVARSLVAAGETGGQLSVMLDRLSKLTRQQAKIHKTISSAMVYPALLLCIAFGVIVTMVTFVLPRFEGLFESMGSELPPLTALLMDLSHFLRGWWYVLVPALGLGAGAAIWWLRSPSGAKALDLAFVRVPKLGEFTRAYSTARLARVLGTLLEGKVPLLEALVLARYTVRNSLYVALVARAEECVLRGESLSAALGDSPLLPGSLVEAVRSGEKSGQLATVLSSLAEFLEEDTETTIRAVTSLLEPLILLALGLVVGAMAIAIMLPLFDLTATAGGPGAGGAP